MHEFSVASEIAALVKQTAGSAKVLSVNINIGALSGIFSESLLMYLEIVLPDMGMENVKVETKQIPATFECACGTSYVAEKITAVCPECGGIKRKMTAGHDCTVESIEVDDE